MILIKLFEYVFLSSITGSVLVLSILCIKALLRHKLNYQFHYIIWLLVIIKLLLPFGIKNAFNIYSVFRTQVPYVLTGKIQNYSQVYGLPNNINDVEDKDLNNSENTVSIKADTLKPSKIYILQYVFCYFWIIGILIMATSIILGIRRVNKIISDSDENINEGQLKILRECIYTANIQCKVKLVFTSKISNPSVYGIINPIILIPIQVVKNISEREFRYILLHELSHVKRKDILINWIISLFQTVYWFNPIILYGLYKMKLDCEIACDIQTISFLSNGENISYGKAIIKTMQICSKSQWLPGTASWGANKSEIKRRITIVSNYKKLSKRGTAVGGALILALGIVALSSGMVKADLNKGQNNGIGAVVNASKGSEETKNKDNQARVNEPGTVINESYDNKIKNTNSNGASGLSTDTSAYVVKEFGKLEDIKQNIPFQIVFPSSGMEGLKLRRYHMSQNISLGISIVTFIYDNGSKKNVKEIILSEQNNKEDLREIYKLTDNMQMEDGTVLWISDNTEETNNIRVIFKRGEITYTITGTFIDKQQLIEIAQSIK